MHDLTIIGGGPVGLYAATYAASLGLRVHLIEAVPQLGGQPALLYPEKYIYDLPAFLKITARDFVAQLMGLLPPSVHITTGQYVQAIQKSATGFFEVHTEEQTYESRFVLITTGNGIFAPRKLAMDLGQFDNIHYHIPNLQIFSGKDVVIFGGGDSAIDWALMLEDVAKTVSVVHRREGFRAHASSMARLNCSTVQIKTPYLLEDLKGDDRMARQIDLVRADAPSEKLSLWADEIIVLYGFSASAGPQKGWGLDLYRNQIIVDAYQQTNLDGVYGAGDACYQEGKVKMIITGISEAIRAVDHIKNR